MLRAALASRSDYLWDHHVPLALREGLTEADIEGVRAGAHRLTRWTRSSCGPPTS